MYVCTLSWRLSSVSSYVDKLNKYRQKMKLDFPVENRDICVSVDYMGSHQIQKVSIFLETRKLNFKIKMLTAMVLARSTLKIFLTQEC